jgi:hypothetical protein
VSSFIRIDVFRAGLIFLKAKAGAAVDTSVIDEPGNFEKCVGTMLLRRVRFVGGGSRDARA